MFKIIFSSIGLALVVALNQGCTTKAGAGDQLAVSSGCGSSINCASDSECNVDRLASCTPRPVVIYSGNGDTSVSGTIGASYIQATSRLEAGDASATITNCAFASTSDKTLLQSYFQNPQLNPTTGVFTGVPIKSTLGTISFPVNCTNSLGAKSTTNLPISIAPCSSDSDCGIDQTCDTTSGACIASSGGGPGGGAICNTNMNCFGLGLATCGSGDCCTNDGDCQAGLSCASGKCGTGGSTQVAASFSIDPASISSIYLTIPTGQYADTSTGIARIGSSTGSSVGTDRPLIVSTSGAYYSLTNWTYSVTLTLSGNDDVVFIGFGQGINNANFSNEPANAFMFRISSLPSSDTYQVDGVVAGVDLDDSRNPTPYLEHQPGLYIGLSVGVPTTFTITRSDDNITLDMPGLGIDAQSYSISLYNLGLTDTNGYLFVGNSSNGLVINNISVVSP